MNHNELISRREDLEQQLTELAAKAAGCEIARDAYAAAKNRLAAINAKLGE